MPRMQCNHCSASVPAAARFCSRCGQGMATHTGRHGGAATRPHGALPSTSPMPLAGILFLAAAVLGPTLIAVGISTATPLVLLAGVAISIVLIVLMFLGMVF